MSTLYIRTVLESMFGIFSAISGPILLYAASGYLESPHIDLLSLDETLNPNDNADTCMVWHTQEHLIH